MFISQLSKTLQDHQVRYAIVGGHAVALHGALRGTVDIDFIIDWQKKQLHSTEAALKSLGLVSRLPITADDVFNFRDEYIRNKNLIAWNFYHPKHLDQEVDIIITLSLGKKSIETVNVEGIDIHYLNKKDLIKMKQASGREQDLADIQALKAL